MTEAHVLCIICPVGCKITVSSDDTGIQAVSGHACPRGARYAKDEIKQPVRILTAVMATDSPVMPMLPVRSNKPIAKHLLLACMKTIQAHRVSGPIARYDCLIANIQNSGADIVATGELPGLDQADSLR
jgi:CxxC motif-containing protein